jgi:LDH2 family malate/lactate/ureidoglycolate dehydrogenase
VPGAGPGGAPLVLDFATSLVANGKVRNYYTAASGLVY